jgi:hypothetical protein
MSIKLKKLGNKAYACLECICACITIGLFCGIMFFLTCRVFYIALWFVRKIWFLIEILGIMMLWQAPILLSIFYFSSLNSVNRISQHQQQNPLRASIQIWNLHSSIDRSSNYLQKIKCIYRVQ